MQWKTTGVLQYEFYPSFVNDCQIACPQHAFPSKPLGHHFIHRVFLIWSSSFFLSGMSVNDWILCNNLTVRIWICRMKENSSPAVLQQKATVWGETGRLVGITLSWRWPTLVGSSWFFFVTLGKWLNLIYFCYLQDWGINSVTLTVFVMANWNDNWKLVVSTV